MKPNILSCLTELIDDQKNVIEKQLKLITKLIQDNAEKENIINELIKRPKEGD